MSEMNLGDAFSKKKQLHALIDKWINRLSLAGKEEVTYIIQDLTDSQEKADAGTKIKHRRAFTIKECMKRIYDLIEDLKKLLLRISLTNQKASAKLINLDGKELDLTIPELIVLKNEIAPKLETILRNIPRQSTGREVVATTTNYIKWRTIEKLISRTREITNKGLQRDVDVFNGYRIKEVLDYGFTPRTLSEREDILEDYTQRIKEAINHANKTPLIFL